MTDRDFTRLEGETVFDGAIVSIERAQYRYPDGAEVTREVIHHPGAVGVVPVDGEHVWLVRQPREAAGEPDMLEIPAGKLDADGESPLQTGQRELAEEIGKGADQWEHLVTFFTSCGVMDEQVHVYLARGLHDATAEPPHEDERIEVVPWPLAELDEAIAATRDSKSLIGLLLLKERMRR